VPEIKKAGERGYIKAGKLRALGVTTTEPLAFLPDVPTIDSFLKGYEAAGWIGFGVPRGTSPETIATLNMQTNAAVLLALAIAPSVAADHDLILCGRRARS
jgi:tripartite-type tricarboxylate transporter receptor subunit TctC